LQLFQLVQLLVRLPHLHSVFEMVFVTKTTGYDVKVDADTGQCILQLFQLVQLLVRLPHLRSF
jgi:hypothetical protein